MSVERKPEIEPKPQKGRVDAIVGPMFSGKSDELIRRMRRAKYANKKVQVFIPEIDTRRGAHSVNTYDGIAEPAEPVKNSEDILKMVQPDTHWVIIDEAQFFDMNLVGVVDNLALQGKRVIIAGLETNFRGEPFGPMADINRLAEKSKKMHARCVVCHGKATRTQRIVNGKPAHYDEPVVVVGAEELYEARCRKHHEVPRD
jgi:thymidine kinase